MDHSKQQKFYEGQNIGEDDDKISNLPDCIVHHILSFLPTKDAVGTFVLSTRWKHLWTSVPNIDFDDSLLYSSEINDWYPLQLTCFMNFVERLKTLHLCLVTFRDDDSTQKLFSSCLVLQDLAILDCEWMNLKSITISIPTLKSLTIDDLSYFGSKEELKGCEIKIDEENLLFLKYIGYLVNQLCLCNLLSLVNASIHIPTVHVKQKRFAYHSVSLLKGLHHVKSVRIANGTIKVIFYHLPMYRNVTYLELSTQIKNHSVGALMDLLQCLTNLESLVFAEGLDPYMCLSGDDWILKPVPKCFLSCLKSVSLQNFPGNGTELCFLKLLLKNALALERMKIFYSKNPSLDPRVQKEASNQLQMLPRGWTDCLIMFF